VYFDIRMAPKASKVCGSGKLARLRVAEYISEVIQLDADQEADCRGFFGGCLDTRVHLYGFFGTSESFRRRIACNGTECFCVNTQKKEKRHKLAKDAATAEAPAGGPPAAGGPDAPEGDEEEPPAPKDAGKPPAAPKAPGKRPAKEKEPKPAQQDAPGGRTPRWTVRWVWFPKKSSAYLRRTYLWTCWVPWLGVHRSWCSAYLRRTRCTGCQGLVRSVAAAAGAGGRWRPAPCVLAHTTQTFRGGKRGGRGKRGWRGRRAESVRGVQMGKGAAVPWARGAKRGGWVKRGCPPAGRCFLSSFFSSGVFCVFTQFSGSAYLRRSVPVLWIVTLFTVPRYQDKVSVVQFCVFTQNFRAGGIKCRPLEKTRPSENQNSA
jgi:hypothetical protein